LENGKKDEERKRIEKRELIEKMKK